MSIVMSFLKWNSCGFSFSCYFLAFLCCCSSCCSCCYCSFFNGFSCCSRSRCSSSCLASCLWPNTPPLDLRTLLPLLPSGAEFARPITVVVRTRDGTAKSSSLIYGGGRCNVQGRLETKQKKQVFRVPNWSKDGLCWWLKETYVGDLGFIAVIFSNCRLWKGMIDDVWMIQILQIGIDDLRVSTLIETCLDVEPSMYIDICRWAKVMFNGWPLRGPLFSASVRVAKRVEDGWKTWHAWAQSNISSGLFGRCGDTVQKVNSLIWALEPHNFGAKNWLAK